MAHTDNSNLMVTEKTTSSTHLQRDVSTILSQLEPDLYPLDTLLRRMKQGKPAKASKIEWASVSSYPRSFTTTNSVDAADAGSMNVVTVADSSMIKVKDVFILVGVPTCPPLMVGAKEDDSTTFHLYGLGDGSLEATPAIPAGSVLAYIGNVKTEGDTYSAPKSIDPEYSSNYVETFDHVVKISEIRKRTANYTNVDDWTRVRRDNLKEFRRSLEAKMWFGKASKVTNTIDATMTGYGEYMWTMNGVTRYITKTLEYDKDVVNQPKITESMVIDWLVSVFSGNNGSTSRFLFADSYLAGEIMKVPLANLRSREIKQVLGVQVEELVFNFGKVYVKHARIFNELGFNNYGVVLDMEQLSKRTLRPMEKIQLKLKDIGVDAEAEQYIESSSIEVHNPATHAIIQGV